MTVPNESLPVTELTGSIDKSSSKVCVYSDAHVIYSDAQHEKRSRYKCLLKPKVEFEFLYNLWNRNCSG